MPRDRQVDAAYQLDRPANGFGSLTIEWTDTLGRTVERRNIPVHFDHATAVTFPLDLRRAVAMVNHVNAHLSFSGVTATGARDLRERDAQASFVAQPDERPWSHYQIIMWQTRNPEQYATLKRLGVTAGTLLANRGDQPADYVPRQLAPLVESDMRWYVENIATDFYSAYHRWSPDRPENWRFLELKRRYRENSSDRSALFRDPSLSDPAWRKRIESRLIDSVRSQRLYRPLYYSLGDETGIADLSSFWDFDFSDDSLRAMRQWLRETYPDLRALNTEWGSHFQRWVDVTPMTTPEAVRRTDGNFSAWADFKAWMDTAFARALRAGTRAVHHADPSAYAAIEGAQIPGWGGYDYSQLVTAVDAMEIYDYGDNIDIAHSLNPRLAILTSHSGAGMADIHQIWRELLLGSRGLVLWDPNSRLVGEDGALGQLGKEAIRYFDEMRSGLGDLLLSSDQGPAPVAILYSPESERTQWILDQAPKGDAWAERTAESEYEDNAVRAARRTYLDLVERIGVPHRFISPGMISRGDLVLRGFKVLMLPHAISLSRAEAVQIRRFTKAGGLVIADTNPGTFDNHSRELPSAFLRDEFGNAARPALSTGEFGRGRAAYFPALPPAREGDHAPCTDQADQDRMTRLLATVGTRPVFLLRGATGTPPTDVRSFFFRNGEATVIALLRDACAGNSDRAQTDLPETEQIRLTLTRRRFVYDVLARRSLGSKQDLDLELGRTDPAILAISDAPLPTVAISGMTDARLGDTARLNIGLIGARLSGHHAIHVEVRDPSGTLLSHYSTNVSLAVRQTTFSLPLALNDPPGIWHIRATDALTGSSAAQPLRVTAPLRSAP